MVRKELEDVTVELLHQTDRAWYVDDGNKKVWIAKSLGEMERNTDGTWCLTAPIWLLKDKELL